MDEIVSTLNQDTLQLFKTQKEINKSSNQLIQNLTKFESETKEWSKLISDLNLSVKNLGDIQVYTSFIEDEIMSMLN